MARSRLRFPAPVLLSLALAAPLAGQRLAAAPAAPATLAAVPLSGASGQALLVQSGQRADYGPLAQEFVTQANLAYCGVASAVMVLSSLGVPAPAAAGYGAYRFWTQENVFEAAAGAGIPRPEVVKRQGMTLAELEGLLAAHGLAVERIHGDAISLEGFRALLRRNLAEPGDRLLVNYARGSLGQAGGGHISPLAAYHAPSDRVLILDVARYRYPALWVPTRALWRAMRTLDNDSGRSRGLLTIRRATPATPPPGSAAPPGPS